MFKSIMNTLRGLLTFKLSNRTKNRNKETTGWRLGINFFRKTNELDLERLEKIEKELKVRKGTRKTIKFSNKDKIRKWDWTAERRFWRAGRLRFLAERPSSTKSEIWTVLSEKKESNWRYWRSLESWAGRDWPSSACSLVETRR